MHSFVKRAIIPLTAAAVSLLAALLARRNLHWLWVLVVSLPMLLLGIFDWLQKSWNITRNYPVAGRIRWIFYRLRPYLRDLLKSERAVARFSTINQPDWPPPDRKSTRLNSSHVAISYAVFCLKKKTTP